MNVAAVVLECVVVLGAGLGLGLAANALADDGIELGRDYFPDLGRRAPRASEALAPTDESARDADATATTPAGTGGPSEAAAETPDPASDPGAPSADETFAPAHVLERLAEHGLQPMLFDEARATWEDPLRAFGAYVFVDARQEDPYAEGHVPGAYLFDRYRPERHLPEITPLLATSARIVVYCNGGECEDSEYAADHLLQFGAAPESVFVFVGGIAEWTARGMPLERGARDSGDLVGGTSDG